MRCNPQTRATAHDFDDVLPLKLRHFVSEKEKNFDAASCCCFVLGSIVVIQQNYCQLARHTSIRGHSSNNAITTQTRAPLRAQGNSPSKHNLLYNFTEMLSYMKIPVTPVRQETSSATQDYQGVRWWIRGLVHS
ncbi:hypothetical protein PSAC2689_190054 [Paraburkholderia sacchari]